MDERDTRLSIRNVRRLGTRSVAALVLVIGAVSLNSLASQAPRPTSVLRGSVLDARSGSGVTGVQIALASPTFSAYASTDESGRFSFAGVPSGSYSITATADGYVRGAYGQLWPGGPATSVVVGDASRTQVSLSLWRTVSIAGTVSNGRGNAVPAVVLRVWSLDPAASDGPTQVAIVRSDENGHFAVRDIKPGTYVVGTVQTYETRCTEAVVSGRPSRLSCRPHPLENSLAAERDAEGKVRLFATTFYPQAASIADAQPITLRAGDTWADADVLLEAQPTVTVAGVLVGPQDRVADVPIALSRARVVGMTPFMDVVHARTTSTADGRFTLVGVPPGAYELRALSAARQGRDIPPHRVASPRGGYTIRGTVAGLKPVTEQDPLLEANQPIVLEHSSVQGLELQLGRAARVVGELDAGEAEAAARSATVSLKPLTATLGMRPASALVSDGLRFSFPSLASGRYSLTVSSGTRLVPRALEVDGYEAPGGVLEVQCCSEHRALLSVTDKLATLSTMVSGARVGESESYPIFIFPEDRRLWVGAESSDMYFRMRRTQAGQVVSMGPLVPGQYFVAALGRTAFDFDWRHSESLKNISRVATRLAVKSGEQAQVTLTPSRMP